MPVRSPPPEELNERSAFGGVELPIAVRVEPIECENQALTLHVRQFRREIFERSAGAEHRVHVSALHFLLKSGEFRWRYIDR